MSLQFDVIGSDGAARRGRLTTAHGSVDTPAFMPVGTLGTVKGLLPEQVAASGAQILLGNTYHLMLRPGAERVARLGGLRRFMGWEGPILTDSGGFQVMSLARFRKIEERGATFKSHLDGSLHELTPERSIEIQYLLDANITMQLDECIGYPAPEGEAERAMELSLRWAERCKQAFTKRPGYGLFGIVQGGVDETLRQASARALADMEFDGYAVGGLAVGEPQEIMLEVLGFTLPFLPKTRPRYLMGVGTPEDLVKAVLKGVDMFDCVLPTRSGRTARGYTRRGVINLRNARHRDDPRPIDPDCPCPSCSRWSRAYLHHLFRAEEMLGPILLTLHNLHYYQEVMAELRSAIERGSTQDFAAAFFEQQASGDLPAVAS
ncbi:MAG TPA: tRNA guanosine(34) transglycosylase Tgt [Kiloniellales bacterium]|nr:tRNA guanosine(34) transglycosylase Tgt [Kiloniellales bacterium]